MKLQSKESVHGSLRPKILAIIPARGGSKGLPRKNIRQFGGKPLVAWTIEAALGADFLDRTIVSTEDAEIAEIAKGYGAEVIDRPPELAQDKTLIQPVLEQVVKFLEEKEGYIPDVIMLLNPTSPLRGTSYIDKACHDYIQTASDTLVSVCSCRVYLWHKRKDGNHVADYDFEHKGQRQDELGQVMENGAIYMVSRKFLLEKHELLGGRIGMIQMTRAASADIDDMLDFIIAEAILNAGVISQP